MANKITQDKIVEINIAYLKYKTYSGAAKETGVSASTVKKYVISNFIPPEITEKVKFNGELPQFGTFEIPDSNWSDWCKLSPAEEEEIKKLWKELII